jgi:hypothetical protein
MNASDMTVAPPSFVPQINNLGQMIDTFTQRRLKMAKDEADAQSAQAEVDRKIAWDKEKEAYGRRKQDIAEKKVDQESLYRQMKANQGEHNRASNDVGAGKDPGTSIFFENGNPISARWKFQRGPVTVQPDRSPPQPVAPSPAAPAAAPAQAPALPGAASITGTMMGRPLSAPTASPAPQPQAEPQLPGAAAIVNRSARMPEPVASASPDGQVTAPSDQELEALMAASHGQGAPAERSSDNSVFLDETDDGTANVLMGPNGEQRRQLPLDALPPGAREGQRFAPDDVNLSGGKGNPFAGPIGEAPAAPAGRKVFVDETDEGNANVLMGPGEAQRRQLPLDALPPGAREGQRFDENDVSLNGGKGNPFAGPDGTVSQPQSSSTFVPGAQIRGMSAQAQPQIEQTASGKWVAVTEDGRVIAEIDPSQARAARQAENAQSLRETELALAMPGLSSAEVAYLSQKKHGIMAGMSPKELSQVYAQAGRETLQGNQIASTEKVAGEGIASREKLAAEANATRRATSKYGRGGAGAGRAAVVQSSGEGSAFSRLKPMEQARVENSVNNGIGMLDREMNWTKLEGVGFDRLNLALQNIRAKGDLGGAQQMEAMMNFFGYIRGGVPAKNETDEFKHTTSTLGTMLDRLGQKVGLGDLWTNFTGSQADKEAIAKIAQLPAGQRAGLEQAIIESQKAIQGMATKNIQAQAEAYKSAGQPFHERMQDKINSKLRFIGEKPRQWFRDSPLIPDFNAEGSPGSAGQGEKKPSLRELLSD